MPDFDQGKRRKPGLSQQCNSSPNGTTSSARECTISVTGFTEWALPPQQEYGLPVLCRKSLDIVHSSLKDGCDLLRGRVAEAHLNHLRRMATDQSTGQKVVVFCENAESFVPRKPPYPLIVFARERHVPNMATAGKAWHKNVNEPKRQVLVDQRFHATDPRSRRSRSAANAKQARMSSLVSSGKSARISASVIPDARYSSTSETVIRRPRTQGFPLRLPGSTVMR